MNFRKRSVENQSASLQALAELVQGGIEHPYVRATALKIVRDCSSRDDECELNALFNAVRDGDEAVEALKKGFPYRADPKTIDWFSSADRILKMCEHGACGGDCDEHAVLLASLAGTLGFTTGLRAFGPDPKKDRFTHVYAVALTPKKAVVPPGADGLGYGDYSSLKRTVVGLDTTVDRAYPGWQPEGGRYKTAWIFPPKGGV